MYAVNIDDVSICRCRIAALDCRGHGDTTTEDDADLSADTLCQVLYHRRPSWHTALDLSGQVAA